MRKIKVGILGGTFDPVHNGHLILASETKNVLGLDRIIFVPAFLPPHKKRKILNIEHRLNMLRLALKGCDCFEISTYEVEQKKECFTVDTLRHFQDNMPNVELFFIAGSDNLSQLHTWKNPETIFTLAKFVTATRPKTEGFEQFRKIYKKIKFVKISALDISSSEIRRRVKCKKRIKYLVPDLVGEYISKNKLYS